MNRPHNTMTRAWLLTLDELFRLGEPVAPRGQPTVELLQQTMTVDMRHPVLLAPTRALGEKFLAAEAHWILSGDNRVATIAPYSKRISQFSDDGETFFGAYGPKVVAQLDYVVNKLQEDPDTRQAGLNIWRENPPATKDVPCTVAMFFNIRHGALNMHVFMRSSDIWLGVPYDVFNFSMIAHLVCCRLNTKRDASMETPLVPGELYLTAASRHLYDRDRDKAHQSFVLDAAWASSMPTPFVMYTNESALMAILQAIMTGKEEAKWWSIP